MKFLKLFETWEHKLYEEITNTTYYELYDRIIDRTNKLIKNGLEYSNPFLF